jgi:hypothetical protein
MNMSANTHIRDELERHIRLRTGRAVRNLDVEFGPERVIIRGQTGSYYLKQLAQHGVRDVLPEIRLDNHIVVEHRPNGARRGLVAL